MKLLKKFYLRFEIILRCRKLGQMCNFEFERSFGKRRALFEGDDNIAIENSDNSRKCISQKCQSGNIEFVQLWITWFAPERTGRFILFEKIEFVKQQSHDRRSEMVRQSLVSRTIGSVLQFH